MKKIITGADHIFGPWIAEQLNFKWTPGRGATIGLIEDGNIIACQLYTDCNGRSVVGHLAGIGKRWMNREYLWYCFYYPFEQLKVDKILGIVESTNIEAQRLDEHLGFTLEATLSEAAPKGDLLIYSMTRSQCKWLALGSKYRGGFINGQAISASSA